MTETEQIKLKLLEWAEKHNVVLQTKGECGIFRKCVGFFGINDCYVDYNPCDNIKYEPLEEFFDERLNPPREVEDAYHKHECMSVLVHSKNYGEALRQLLIWTEHYDKIGVEITEYTSTEQTISTFISGNPCRQLSVVKIKEQNDKSAFQSPIQSQ